MIVDIIDKNFVLVDGPEVQRRRCNIKHLEPTTETLSIERGADTETVKRVMGGS